MTERAEYVRRIASVLGACRSRREVIERLCDELEASEVFFGHGTDNALDEAVVLGFHVFGLPFDTDERSLSKPVSAVQCQTLATMMTARVCDRIPAPYLTGEAWFAGEAFHVDPRVLIPRSPIAEWIERQFSPWVVADEVHEILEIGAGSGCIAIALAKAFPVAKITATDIDPHALAVARINVARHGLEERVLLIEGDLFAGLDQRFDLVVSNPPYVDQTEIDAMPPEFGHEPRSALAAGEDGLDVVRRMLQTAPDFVTESASLVIEVGASQVAFEQAYPCLAVTWLELEHGGDGVFLVEAKDLTMS